MLEADYFWNSKKNIERNSRLRGRSKIARTIRGISADKITEEFVEAAKFGNSAKERKGEASFDRFIDRSVT
ncbi:hypothetical protein HZH66_014389 [Vespula vulgaris]|uniref:Uncharacterized protein n=1 Tax=Vespula vulgaris TaxID=7454 RepID=A0A834J1B5_VESVU|nr:hypothetical protein HZH66_014389 [Vespula vulgaris]